MQIEKSAHIKIKIEQIKFNKLKRKILQIL